ncbi:MAG: hypothetical protein ACF788_09175 [Novipirellula sp. JB048]
MTTDEGIWGRLAEGVAAPIVESYNGNRYGLATGSCSACGVIAGVGVAFRDGSGENVMAG